MRIRLVTSLLCAILVPSIVPAAEKADPPAPPPDPAVRRLFARTIEEREIVKKEILGARKRLIQELCTIITDSDNYINARGTIWDAMELLGEIRAAEAAPSLVESIGFPYVPHPKTGAGFMNYPHTDWDKIDWEKRSPAVCALVRIGEPSIDPVIAKLDATRNELVTRLCREVLVRLARKLDLRQRINKAADAAPEDRKTEFRAVLEAIQGDSRGKEN